MTYSTGSLITAADLNGYLTTVRNIYGTGTGDRGYGQTAYTQAAVSSGSRITSVQWTALQNMIATCNTHQGNTATNLTTTVNSRISYTASLPGAVTGIDTNRLNATVGDMTLTSGAGSSVRTGAWTNNLSTIVDVTWGSEDAARYYFNSGGQIRVRLTQPAGTAQDTAWSTIFSNVGTLTIGANASSRSGTAGTVTSYGYYQMPAAQSLIINGTDIGGGAYATNDLLIYVNRLNYAGVNGGNGTGFRVMINLQDQHTAAPDSVVSGTTALFDTYRCTSTLAGITAPTIGVNTAWTAS